MGGGEYYLFLVFVSSAIYESVNGLFYFFGYAGFWKGEDGGNVCNFGQETGFGYVHFCGCCQFYGGPDSNFSFDGLYGLFQLMSSLSRFLFR